MVFKFLGMYFFIVSYNPLRVGGISCNLSSFISDFVYLGPLSFFLDKSAKRLVNVFYLFKEPAPGFIDPVFLVSMSFNSALILDISFLPHALGLLLLFSKFL